MTVVSVELVLDVTSLNLGDDLMWHITDLVSSKRWSGWKKKCFLDNLVICMYNENLRNTTETMSAVFDVF